MLSSLRYIKEDRIGKRIREVTKSTGKGQNKFFLMDKVQEVIHDMLYMTVEYNKGWPAGDEADIGDFARSPCSSTTPVLLLSLRSTTADLCLIVTVATCLGGFMSSCPAPDLFLPWPLREVA